MGASVVISGTWYKPLLEEPADSFVPQIVEVQIVNPRATDQATPC